MTDSGAGSFEYVADILFRTFCPLQGQFSLFFTVMNKIVSDTNAQVLTSIMKSVLDQLDELACRVVQKEEEYEFMLIRAKDAVLQAAIGVEPLCEGDLSAEALNKSMKEMTMSDLQFFNKLHSKGRVETFTETELKQAEEEAKSARQVSDQKDKEGTMQEDER